jgi:hypothetical protein
VATLQVRCCGCLGAGRDSVDVCGITGVHAVSGTANGDATGSLTPVSTGVFTVHQ